MNFVDSQVASDPKAARNVVRRAIALLEKNIADEFGFKVNMGAELEYIVEYKGDALDQNFLSDEPQILPYKELANRHSISSFPLSRLVAYSYSEYAYMPAHSNVGACQQFETVLSHKHTLPMAQFADAIAGLQKEVLRSSGFGISTVKKGKSTITDIQKQRALEDDIRAEHVASVTLKTIKYGMPNGLHINFSLTPSDGKEKDPISLYNDLVDATEKLFIKEKALLHAQAHEIMRWDMLENSPNALQVRTNQKPYFGNIPYIENRLPAATNSPHVAVLMQLTAIYAGLRDATNPESSKLVGLGLIDILEKAGITDAATIYSACQHAPHAHERASEVAR